MNVLGIGPGELIVIMIILLVVVGPERLPGLARQGGQMLVRVRNWVQKSPDAAMIMRARQEIEQELASLRSSLLEVQNVRDEVIQAARQVNQTFTEDIGGAFKEIADTINKDGIQAVKQSANDALTVANSAVQSAEAAADAAATSASNGQAVARARSRQASFGPQQTDLAQNDLLEQLLDSEPTDESAGEPVASADFSALSTQIEGLLREMQALQTELRARGVLDADWHPPVAPSEASVEPDAVAVSLDDAPPTADDATLLDGGTPPSDDDEPHTDSLAEELQNLAALTDAGTPPSADDEPPFIASTDSLADEPHFATSTETISEEQLP